MEIIVPFTGGGGREVLDVFGLRSIPVWHPVEGEPSVGLMSPGLLMVWTVFVCWNWAGHTQPVPVCGGSWGTLVLWAHWFSSHCFALLFPVARDDVERQARVWLSSESKAVSGEMEAGFSGSRQPCLFLGSRRTRGAVSLSWTLVWTLLCVCSIEGKCSEVKERRPFKSTHEMSDF